MINVKRFFSSIVCLGKLAMQWAGMAKDQHLRARLNCSLCGGNSDADNKQTNQQLNIRLTYVKSRIKSDENRKFQGY